MQGKLRNPSGYDAKGVSYDETSMVQSGELKLWFAK
jgi:hypothetical protein